MELMFRPIKHYADFNGRSRRTEYWLFMLFQMIVYVILLIALVVAAATTDPQTRDTSPGASVASSTGDFPVAVVVITILLALAWMFFFLPSLAVQVRRYHDQGMSGMLGLLNIPYYIPYLGLLIGIAILVIMCLPGNIGPNQYGADPKDPQGFDGPDPRLRNIFN